MKILKQAYTTEFKELAVKRVKEGQGIGKVCKELGLSDQTVRNWIKAAAEGKKADLQSLLKKGQTWTVSEGGPDL